MRGPSIQELAQTRTRLSKLAGAIAVILSITLAAAAQGQLRDFSGTVVSTGAQELKVKGSRGDTRRFARIEGVRVDGQRTSWDELRVGDTVVVGWSLTDEPVAARRVHVVSTGSDR
jgi:hypothetical protein